LLTQCAPMDRIEEARLAWQRAQADLQRSLADLEMHVAQEAGAEAVQKARAAVTVKQGAADEMLHRYITHLGKS
jgi:hypothetical protein